MPDQNNHLDKSPKIYNLFPRLVGKVENWLSHIQRASDMGFNWIYINPFHPTGSSGSLYAIKDHFGFNSIFFGSMDHGRPGSYLKSIIQEVNRIGIKAMADLVINHTSKQSHLVKDHPDWYKRDKKGHLIHPGAMDKGKMVYWKDLVEIDNLNSKDRDALWSYWTSVAKHYLNLGFSGFRCDAAYQVPTKLWHFLIHKIKGINPETHFFAETLGCSVEQTLDVAKSGFDYIFNSFKWWDYQAAWFLDQHKRTQPIVPSISFPESHDTTRLAADLKDHLPEIKKRYLLSALLTKGLMIPIGFEFGFHKRLNVKFTSHEDWEEARFDLRDFIKRVNTLKASYSIFNEEALLKNISSQNPDILLLLKDLKDKERCLLIANKNKTKVQKLILDLKAILPGNHVLDLSLDHPLKDIPPQIMMKLNPSEVRILHQKA